MDRIVVPPLSEGALRQHAEWAHDHMADAQKNITYGDCWVTFHDIDDAHLIFGRVWTQEQMALSLLDSGANWHETVVAVAHVGLRMLGGYVYGRAFSRYDTEGTLGEVHKAHIWPIDESVFIAAQGVGFDHRQIVEPGARVLLDLAFRMMRAHYLPQYRTGVRS